MDWVKFKENWINVREIVAFYVVFQEAKMFNTFAGMSNGKTILIHTDETEEKAHQWIIGFIKTVIEEEKNIEWTDKECDELAEKIRKQTPKQKTVLEQHLKKLKKEAKQEKK